MTAEPTTPPSDEGDPAFRVTLEGSGDSFVVTPPESILAAARRAGHWLPYECGWGSCATCKAVVTDGEVRALFPDAPGRSDRDLRRGRHLLCQTTAATDLAIRPVSVSAAPVPERPTQDYIATLAATRELGPSIVELGFTLDRPATFLPGQYAIVRFPDGLARCYSMSSLPGTERVEFIIKQYDGHEGSRRMHALESGDQLAIELPYGDMYLRENDRPAILIAGGTGISAILSMVRGIADDAAWAQRFVHVLYGAGSREDLVCWDELLDLMEDMGQHVHGALVEAPDDWMGHRGFVTGALAALLGAELSAEHDLLTADVYVAGPPVMVRAVEQALDQHGLQRDRFHVDSFG